MQDNYERVDLSIKLKDTNAALLTAAAKINELMILQGDLADLAEDAYNVLVEMIRELGVNYSMIDLVEDAEGDMEAEGSNN